jgi:hypothetical protein
MALLVSALAPLAVLLNPVALLASAGTASRQYDPRNFAPPQQQPQQRGFTTAQPRRDFSRQMEQQNFTARPPMQQRNFTAPRQMEQRSVTPQPHNEGGFGRGGEGRGHGH